MIDWIKGKLGLGPSLLGSKELHAMIEAGYIDALHENVNAASIDVRLGHDFWVEMPPPSGGGIVDLSKKEQVKFERYGLGMYDNTALERRSMVLKPGRFCLAHTVETFNLPDDISGLFILRSSMARNGLEHMQAGWADAGFSDAQLTLELKNELEHHSLLLRPGMRIGQMVFWKHSKSGKDSYALKGSYNGQKLVKLSNGGRN